MVKCPLIRPYPLVPMKLTSVNPIGGLILCDPLGPRKDQPNPIACCAFFGCFCHMSFFLAKKKWKSNGSCGKLVQMSKLFTVSQHKLSQMLSYQYYPIFPANLVGGFNPFEKY